MAAKLLLFNKPYQVLSQFTDNSSKSTLADYIDIKSVYPAGRLDFDSEGLLLLTDNGRMQAQISHPKYKLSKTYWVQVEGIATQRHCAALCGGVVLKDGPASAISCRLIPEPTLWPRNPPIRVRKSVPDSWLEIIIAEGRNRQVRRMTAALDLPCLRLVRPQIGQWSLGQLQPGEYRLIELSGDQSLQHQRQF